MRMLTVGDSFTYGQELSNLSNAWPYVLANNYLKCSVKNLAKPGIGNNHIIKKCVEQVDNYDIVIIAWSHYARIEFSDEWGEYDIWPGCQKIAFADHLSYRKDLIKYITLHHNDEHLYQQYLFNIIFLQAYLTTNQKKYIMLDSFDNHQSPRRNQNFKLTKQINEKYFLGWPNESMMEWTYGCPQGPGGHFLEQGHQQVAEKINEHIRNLGWIS